MNNNYLDEYIKYYVDDNFKRRLIKFHLSCDTSILENSQVLPITLYNDLQAKQKKPKYPDIKISCESFDTADSTLQEILDILGELISQYNIITFLPIISVKTNDNKIFNYGINFDEKKLLLYSKCENNFILQNSSLYIITYFMNIDEGILLYHSDAYIKSILQIGHIKNSLENKIKNKYVISNHMNGKQRWTKALEINPNMELLIATTTLGIKI